MPGREHRMNLDALPSILRLAHRAPRTASAARPGLLTSCKLGADGCMAARAVSRSLARHARTTQVNAPEAITLNLPVWSGRLLPRHLPLLCVLRVHEKTSARGMAGRLRTALPPQRIECTHPTCTLALVRRHVVLTTTRCRAENTGFGMAGPCPRCIIVQDYCRP